MRLTAIWWAFLCGLLAGIGQCDNPFVVQPSLIFSDRPVQLQVRFLLPPGHLLYADTVKLELSDRAANCFQLPSPVLHRDPHGEAEKWVFQDTFTVECELGSLPATNLVLTVSYQGCDEASCYFPETRLFTVGDDGSISRLDPDQTAVAGTSVADSEWRSLADQFEIVGVKGGYLHEREVLELLQARVVPEVAASPAWTAGGGAGLTCLLVFFLGGLGLNLTPSVLPMIPVNLATLGAGSRARSRWHGLALGGAYGLGMSLTYGLLGVMVVLADYTFGSLNSSPWFNLLVALIFLVMALCLAGHVRLDLSRWRVGSESKLSFLRSRLLFAALLGAVAALLAGACVAPVVITAMVQAAALYRQGEILGLVLPFVLGIGMALPWPLAGAGIPCLPRPGRWMAYVRGSFALFIAMLGLYQGYLALGLMRTSSPPSARTQPGSDPSRANPLLSQLSDGLSLAKSKGKPVFIDFWASWCKSCAAMEASTLRSKTVQRELGRFCQIKLQVEHPSDDVAQDVLKYFGVVGMPAYAVLVPRDPRASKKLTQQSELLRTSASGLE